MPYERSVLLVPDPDRPSQLIEHTVWVKVPPVEQPPDERHVGFTSSTDKSATG